MAVCALIIECLYGPKGQKQLHHLLIGNHGLEIIFSLVRSREYWIIKLGSDFCIFVLKTLPAQDLSVSI